MFVFFILFFLILIIKFYDCHFFLNMSLFVCVSVLLVRDLDFLGVISVSFYLFISSLFYNSFQYFCCCCCFCCHLCVFVRFGRYMFHFLFVVVVSQFELSHQKKSKTKTRILTDAAAIEAHPHTYSTHTSSSNIVKYLSKKKTHMHRNTQLYKKEIFVQLIHTHLFVFFLL